MTRKQLDEITAVVGVLAVIGLLFLLPGARAETGNHGIGHARHHNWYKGLTRPDTKGSCCDDQDCRPTRARFNATTGNWEAVKDGRWITIPPSKIIDGDVPQEAAGEAHLCAPPPTWTQYGPDEVFCFIRPSGGI
jgi:hypothetical protein